MRIKSKSVKFHIIAASFLFVALLSQLVVRLKVLHTCYEIESVRVAALDYDTRLRDLKLQYAVITRPEKLLIEAENRLALTPTNPNEVRTF